MTKRRVPGLSTLLTILGVIALGWMVLGAALFLFQDRLVYGPTGHDAGTPADIGLRYDDLTLPVENGESLSAWFVHARDPRGTLVFCHGNAGNISHRLQSLQLFTALGLNVLIFDYEGYGDSTGKASEDALYRDAQTAWNYLTRERGEDPARIVIFGRSLGGGPAAWLATQEKAAGLILESTFTSVPELAQEIYPLFVLKPLVRNKVKNRERIQEVSCPVLVAHSPDDDVVPYHHGQELYALAPEPKQFLEMRGLHNDAFLTSGELYRSGMDSFFTSVLPSR